MELNFEKWADLVDEALPLMALHHLEVGSQRPIPFRPDVDQAQALDLAGALGTAVARKDGEMVGYLMWFFSNDLESRGTVIASQGPFFVAPPHRHSGAAIGLLDFSIDHFRSIGVHNVLLHHWVGGERLAKKFERMGAKPLESVWSLWIGEAEMEK